jgi:hypothetical protein
MITHLRSCAPDHDHPNGASTDLFQVRVEARNAPIFWLDVEIKGSSPIRRLDDLLRRAWLECCGHLSAFESLGVRYAVVVDREYGPHPNERSMNARVADVFGIPGQRLSYEYDFGSTTELSLRFVSTRRGNIGRGAARLLARNEAPAWKCAVCEASATLVCPFCMVENAKPFVCSTHARDHACGDDESLLPVVNSPRMGVCGYTG